MANDTVDVRLLQAQYDRVNRDLDRERRKNGGHEPPGGDGVDTRIINLERDMTDAKIALAKVETRLEHIEKTMLTKGQTAAYALVAGIAVFGAGWWVVQQYLAPLVASIAK
ncbi:hypothetical protein JIQ88_05470 [Pseudomonas sp. PCH44]|uniref:hypothetical protein n=1 Tax=Pseudomonas sp. PCH44 TaxID=2800904 RepID=UPI001BB0D69F|nr:hypothetical protein [Pseudomonas sp. PCH44]MBS3184513.1 hypothetical protein [Pseudomonas sp. PCH44]